jgi:hypothetical protein
MPDDPNFERPLLVLVLVLMLIMLFALCKAYKIAHGAPF